VGERSTWTGLRMKTMFRGTLYEDVVDRIRSIETALGRSQTSRRSIGADFWK